MISLSTLAEYPPHSESWARFSRPNPAHRFLFTREAATGTGGQHQAGMGEEADWPGPLPVASISPKSFTSSPAGTDQPHMALHWGRRGRGGGSRAGPGGRSAGRRRTASRSGRRTRWRPRRTPAGGSPPGHAHGLGHPEWFCRRESLGASCVCRLSTVRHRGGGTLTGEDS